MQLFGKEAWNLSAVRHLGKAADEMDWQIRRGDEMDFCNSVTESNQTGLQRKEQEELEILGEILESYIDTPIEKDAFLIGDLGLDSFLIVYFISEVDDRFGVTIEMPEHVEYMTVQDVLDQLNQKN